MNIEIIRRERPDFYLDPRLPADKEAILRERGLYTVLKGNNFLTPVLIGYVLIPNGFVELSTVRDIAQLNQYANFGVSVVIDNKYIREQSTAFIKYEDAIKYITELYERQLLPSNTSGPVQ